MKSEWRGWRIWVSSAVLAPPTVLPGRAPSWPLTLLQGGRKASARRLSGRSARRLFGRELACLHLRFLAREAGNDSTNLMLRKLKVNICKDLRTTTRSKMHISIC